MLKVVQQKLHIPCCLCQGHQEHLLSLFCMVAASRVLRTFLNNECYLLISCLFLLFSLFTDLLLCHPQLVCISFGVSALCQLLSLCQESAFQKVFPSAAFHPTTSSFQSHIFSHHQYKSYQTCSVQKSQQPTCTYIYILNVSFKYITEANFCNLTSFSWFLVI